MITSHNFSEHHNMDFIQSYATGAEEWRCSTCGYKFVVMWNPYSKVVLNVGNSNAGHGGSRGGLRIRAVTTGQNSDLWRELYGDV